MIRNQLQNPSKRSQGSQERLRKRLFNPERKKTLSILSLFPWRWIKTLSQLRIRMLKMMMVTSWQLLAWMMMMMMISTRISISCTEKET
ncbi:hypothetical protein FR483_n729L [Paramecium bursaria Chlorella virus FR483]|uniref:Uncharacterized protein n729L n=1 Tax=Paramecium bursaria Chlorella virus FR483 TaxID=399781 RepID=A7J883_PBCVF|nr:hypothetical protein FR483_n729L [Paramecium bursaria Chlorella virus FR483]ABT16014.1 hypothetical protein FR483_n729L [Paramecium bursaria Chlorella virus FR483]